MIDFQGLEGHAEEVAALLSAMGNRKRLIVFCNLLNGELQVSALAKKAEMSQSALSQHLAKLKAGNLVKTRRDAQNVYYSIGSESALVVLRTLNDIYCR